MGKADMTFIGRLDPLETPGVLAIIGRACTHDRIARTGICVPASDGSRAVAAILMEMRGVRRGPDGEDRFPLAVRYGERAEGRLLSVELHPMMREREALAGLVGHLVGGVPGRLIRRLWGRWGETITEPTEQMMGAVGAGHMKFPQFGDEVLKSGLARAASLVGMSVGFSTKREGRGAKVVRISLYVGPAPGWLAMTATADHSDHDVEPVGPRLPASERAALYGLLRAGLAGGRTVVQAAAAIRDWMSDSSDEDDRRMSEVAGACADRASLWPAATALEHALISCVDPLDGLDILASRPWPNGVAGPLAAKAWALRAAACLSMSGGNFSVSMDRLGRALELDERAGIVGESDAAILRSVFHCLQEMIRDPSPEAGASLSGLNRRECLFLVSAAQGASVPRTLLSLAAACEGGGRATIHL